MAWKSILIITAAIVSIYGCAKFKINLFLLILLSAKVNPSINYLHSFLILRISQSFQVQIHFYYQI